MNQREIDRLAKWRAGLILQSVLADGWRPDRMVEEIGEGDTLRVIESIFRLSLKMAPEPSATAPVEVCTHPEAVAEWVPRTGPAGGYYKTACACGAWSVNAFSPPVLEPSPFTP